MRRGADTATPGPCVPSQTAQRQSGGGGEGGALFFEVFYPREDASV